jgi:nucleotide-binding universal stress UspA family protein
MKRILVPCDFSESAIEAYSFALNMAARTEAEVFVLHVMEMPFVYDTLLGPTTYYVEPDMINRLQKEAHRSFERLKEKHPRKDGVTFKAIHGPITTTIRQFITENRIDLVVMGTLGASGWKEYFIGSNTEKVVRFSPVPVLAVRKALETKQIRNIVFPTTLELDQVDLVKRIKDLQSFFSAMLHLLLINTPGNMMRTKDEMEMMEYYARHYSLSNYTLNTRNDFYEQDGIINFAHEMKADMIAMGTHGRRGLAHLFIGSVAEDVVNHVDCPIWTYSIRK